MQISAQVSNRDGSHHAAVTTAGTGRSLPIDAKAHGQGSAVNGGELLMLALATCYCNDLYREAARLGITISGCEVVASAQFEGVGMPASAVSYAARVESSAPDADIERLLAETDRLAEVHNTLRAGCKVERVAWQATPAAATAPGT